MPSNKWDLDRLSSGEYAALKRCAGTMQDFQVRATEAFYHALVMQPHNDIQLSIWFAAMCMQCLWRKEDHPTVKPFEEIARSMYQAPDATASMKNRCVSFIDTAWSNDGFLLGKICRLVRLMHAKDASVMPDFEKLADDLYQWNYPSRYIQKRWLKTICMPTFDNKKEENENVD